MGVQVELRLIQVREVHDFACRCLDKYSPGDVVPISKTRALAWTKNPHAEGDEIALILAYCDGKLLGYLGQVPGRIRDHGRTAKVLWLSTYFVSPDARRTGVGRSLLQKSLESGSHVAGAGASPAAQAVYRRFGFLETAPVTSFVFNAERTSRVAMPFRAMRKCLSKVGLRSDALDRAVRTGSRTGRRRLLTALRDALARGVPDYDVEPTTEIPPFEEAKDARAPLRFDRDRDWIRWMIRDPWVTTDPSENTPGYWFNDVREQFEYRLLDVKNPASGGSRGFAVVRLSSQGGSRDVRVLDYYFHDPSDDAVLAALAVDHAILVGADRIFLPVACRPQIENSPLSQRIFAEELASVFFWPWEEDKEFEERLPQMLVEPADGDCPFA